MPQVILVDTQGNARVVVGCSYHYPLAFYVRFIGTAVVVFEL